MDSNELFLEMKKLGYLTPGSDGLFFYTLTYEGIEMCAALFTAYVGTIKDPAEIAVAEAAKVALAAKMRSHPKFDGSSEKMS